MSRTFSSCVRLRSLNGIRARDEQMQVVDRDLCVRGDRDDLLREHVERVPRDPSSPRSHPRASRARPPPTRADRRGTSGRCAPSTSRRARGPRGRSAAGPRATDLGDSTWITRSTRAHVDAELEARRRDEARDASRLEILLDDHALLARQRAVVSARDLLLRELVQPQREPLGQAPVVGRSFCWPMK